MISRYMSGKDGKIIEELLRMRKFCQTPPKLCFNNQPLASISQLDSQLPKNFRVYMCQKQSGLKENRS